MRKITKKFCFFFEFDVLTYVGLTDGTKLDKMALLRLIFRFRMKNGDFESLCCEIIAFYFM